MNEILVQMVESGTDIEAALTKADELEKLIQQLTEGGLCTLSLAQEGDSVLGTDSLTLNQFSTHTSAEKLSVALEEIKAGRIAAIVTAIGAFIAIVVKAIKWFRSDKDQSVHSRAALSDERLREAEKAGDSFSKASLARIFAQQAIEKRALVLARDRYQVEFCNRLTGVQWDVLIRGQYSRAVERLMDSLNKTDISGELYRRIDQAKTWYEKTLRQAEKLDSDPNTTPEQLQTFRSQTTSPVADINLTLGWDLGDIREGLATASGLKPTLSVNVDSAVSSAANCLEMAKLRVATSISEDVVKVLSKVQADANGLLRETQQDASETTEQHQASLHVHRQYMAALNQFLASVTKVGQAQDEIARYFDHVISAVSIVQQYFIAVYDQVADDESLTDMEHDTLADALKLVKEANKALRSV